MKVEMTWTVGQRAVINRNTVVTVDRVTPTGRPVVGNRTFDVNGIERVKGNPWRRPILEPLTAEIEAEMDLARRADRASEAVHDALEVADRWVRDNLSAWNNTSPNVADVDRAERLAAAIRAVMGVAP
jgi:hypothetical protein